VILLLGCAASTRWKLNGSRNLVDEVSSSCQVWKGRQADSDSRKETRLLCPARVVLLR